MSAARPNNLPAVAKSGMAASRLAGKSLNASSKRISAAWSNAQPAAGPGVVSAIFSAVWMRSSGFLARNSSVQASAELERLDEYVVETI